MSGTPAVPRPVGDAPRRWIAVVRLLPSDLRTDRGFLQYIASGKAEEAFAWLTSKVDEATQRVASLRRTYAKLDALVRRLDRIDRDWFVPYLSDDEQRLYSPWRVRSALSASERQASPTPTCGKPPGTRAN